MRLAVDPRSGSYDPFASIYDWLAAAYSGGGIHRAKQAHVSTLAAGARALYLGCGAGSECVVAASRDISVTVVDTSARMLARCRAAFERVGLQATFIHADALNLSFDACFDVVITPFFLNVFSVTSLPSALRRFLDYLRPGGHFVSVDFRARSSDWLFSQVQRLYYLPPLLLFGLLADNPWHPLYDYVSLAAQHGLPMDLAARSVHDAWGCPLLETLVWTKRC